MGELNLPAIVERHRLLWLAGQEAELRVLGRHLAADVRRRRYPVAVLAAWDQYVARRRAELGIPAGGRRRRPASGIGNPDQTQPDR